MLISFGLTSNQAFAGEVSTSHFPGAETCADCQVFLELCFQNAPQLDCVGLHAPCFQQFCPAVGGDMIQIQTTSVLAAGAQYTAAWMIPVIVSAIGIGIVIARKF